VSYRKKKGEAERKEEKVRVVRVRGLRGKRKDRIGLGGTEAKSQGGKLGKAEGEKKIVVGFLEATLNLTKNLEGI
jgi:hypothetical protein